MILDFNDKKHSLYPDFYKRGIMYTPFGPRFMQRSAIDLLRLYDQHKQQQAKNTIAEGFGQRKEHDLVEHTEFLSVRGAIMAKMDKVEPPFPTGASVRSFRRAERAHGELAPVIREGKVLTVRDFVYWGNLRWCISFEGQDPLSFYEAFDFVLVSSPAIVETSA